MGGLGPPSDAHIYVMYVNFWKLMNSQTVTNGACRFTRAIVPAFTTVLYKFELRASPASPN